MAKNDAISAVLANIEKAMGNKGSKSSFSRFGDIEKDDIPVISFGIKEIDDASYCGGVPRGKMIEIFGPESSGKSLMTLYLIASAQKQGLECALLDIEQSFSPDWAEKHGVDVNKLVYANDFDCGENALEYAYQLCKSNAFGVVVIDSTAALLPKGEIEGTLEDNARIGAQAQMLSRGCRKIVDACGKGNTVCVFINQVRDKIGVMYGSPETTPGGKALRFYSHQRIRVYAKSKITVKDGDQEKVVGRISHFQFVKNKVARPFGEGEFKIIFDQSALNPVVMLVNALRNEKMISIYKGIYKISKDVLDNDNPIITDTTDIPNLADYLVKKDMVLPLLNKLIESVEESNIDSAILEMRDDATKIISPLNDIPAESANGKEAGEAE